MMNRRAFLGTAAMSPILATAIDSVRAQGGSGGQLLFVGTYTGGTTGSRGIYAWRFNAATGRATSLGLAAEAGSPSFLAVHPNKRFLYAVNEVAPGDQGGPGVSAFAINASAGRLSLLNRVGSAGLSPAHLLVDPSGRWVIVSNYGGGSGSEGTTVAVFAVGADGKLAATPKARVQHVPKPKRAGSVPPPPAGNPPVSHPHAVLLSPDSRLLFVPDLGFDEIVTYRFDAASGALSPHTPRAFEAPAGAGPRHVTFGTDAKFLYAILEQGLAVSTYAFDAAAGSLRLLQTTSTLPAGASREGGSCAEIEVHPDGGFLYASNRGHNSIALFEIDRSKGTLVARGHFDVGGIPRHFKIDPTGDYLFAEGQSSNVTVIFKIDRKTGALTKTGATLDSPTPVCVAFV